MFDAIGVSQRTRRPWTVTVSFAGQAVVIGLALLVPLVSTEALPHGRLIELLAAPEPPPPPPPHDTGLVACHKRAPSRFDQGSLRMPTAIPPQPAVIEDPPEFPSSAASQGAGVPGGLGSATGTGFSPLGAVVMPPPEPQAVTQKSGTDDPKRVTRVTIGGLVQQGKLLSGLPPVYPTLAKQARISGVVRLQAVIALNGTILDLHAVSGHPLLIPAALAAVRQWVFQPTFLNGKPVEVATDIEVKFTLQ